MKAVNKVHGLLQQEKWPDEANNFIFVRSDRQMHKVLFKDILVVEGWKITSVFIRKAQSCLYVLP